MQKILGSFHGFCEFASLPFQLTSSYCNTPFSASLQD